MYSCLIVTDDKAETEEYLKLAKQSGGIIESSIRKGMSYISYYDEYEEEFDALICFDEKKFNRSLRHICDPSYLFVAIDSTTFSRKKI